jgi:hypothetical protein
LFGGESVGRAEDYDSQRRLTLHADGLTSDARDE